jgi:hypothetical protein
VNKAALALDYTCRVLEIDPATVPDLATLKAAAKVQRRVLARKHHPDQGGDPATMQEINRVADHVESAEIYFGRALPPRGEILRDAMRQWAAANGIGFRDLSATPTTGTTTVHIHRFTGM